MSFQYHSISSELETLLNDLESENQSSCPITVQSRLHHIRKKGNLLFGLLRGVSGTLIQVIVFKKKNLEAFTQLRHCPRESIVRVSGQFRKSPFKIETTGNYFEIEAEEVVVVSRASEEEMPPIQVEDLNQMGQGSLEERKGRPEVSLVHRLNHRFLDLRSNANKAIFRVRTNLEMLVREFLIKRNFIEIHTPKLISCPSESGASVFSVDYFDQTAYLAQSPQLYKQMMINSDFGKVFEIGAVYRAERSFGHRHLCEFMGLDLEMELKPWNEDQEVGYHQVFETVGEMLHWITTQLENRCSTELSVLSSYYLGSRPVIPHRIPVISFAQGVKWLNEEGFSQKEGDDLNTEAERTLGEIVRQRLGVEIFFLDKYPTNLRPFYTMEDGEGVTRSYDLILRGQEIASGAQRINDYQQLVENIRKHGLTEKHYQDYLNSFKYGSSPHAGLGIGLERLVALYLNIPDVHLTTLFPRDPHRLNP